MQVKGNVHYSACSFYCEVWGSNLSHKIGIAGAFSCGTTLAALKSGFHCCLCTIFSIYPCHLQDISSVFHSIPREDSMPSWSDTLLSVLLCRAYDNRFVSLISFYRSLSEYKTLDFFPLVLCFNSTEFVYYF